MIDDALRIAVREELSGAEGASDAQLDGYIARGKSYLNNKAGAQLDYGAEDLPRQLLMDYCRYAESRATEAFSVNFAEELISLHYDYGLPLQKKETEQNANQDQNPL